MASRLFCIASIDRRLVRNSGTLPIKRIPRARNLHEDEAIELFRSFANISGPTAFFIFRESHGNYETIILRDDQFSSIKPHNCFGERFLYMQQLALTSQKQLRRKAKMA